VSNSRKGVDPLCLWRSVLSLFYILRRKNNENGVIRILSLSQHSKKFQKSYIGTKLYSSFQVPLQKWRPKATWTFSGEYFHWVITVFKHQICTGWPLTHRMKERREHREQRINIDTEDNLQLIFWIFKILFSTLLHLSLLRFLFIGERWDWTQDSVSDSGIGSQSDALNTRLDIIHHGR